MSRLAKSPKLRWGSLDIACVAIAIAGAARSIAGELWPLNRLTTPSVSAALVGLTAVSFAWLMARDYRKHRSLSVVILSLAGVATIAVACSTCNSTCGVNCGDRSASTLISLFGSVLLIVAVLENENLTLERSRRQSLRRRRA